MPMFEDDTGLAQHGEPFRKDASSRQPSPTERPNTPTPGTPDTPSKPIAIPAPTPAYNGRRMSEESIRTELCEGPVSTGPSPLPLSFGARLPPSTTGPFGSPPQPRPSTPPSRDSSSTIDRAELIDRIKRGESPTWVPNRHLENIFHRHSSPSPTQTPRTPSSGAPTPTNLLPAADITPERIPLEAQDQDAQFSARLEDGLNIERPRSALHSGDFTLTSSARRAKQQNQQQQQQQKQQKQQPPHPLSNEDDIRPATTLPDMVQARSGMPGSEFHAVSSSPWVATSPPRHYTPYMAARRAAPSSLLADIGAFRSTVPSPSSSISSSFVYMPPTSPLVQSQNNYDNASDDDNDMDNTFGGSPTNAIDNMRVNTRRHTLTFSHFSYSQSSPFSTPFSAHPSPSSRFSSTTFRRESHHHPYQAHQPRRSLSTNQSFGTDRSMVLHAASTPHTPMLSRSRRPSFSLDASPLQHASMVGSYEESILRGRMSTTPSKPLDFLVQIGVLGLGAKCKPSLRCPAHVTLPFSAVFYSYSTTSHGRSEAEDGPSPYVGMVDLENGLPDTAVDMRSKRKAMMPSRRATSGTRVGVQSTPMDATGKDNEALSATTASDDTVMKDVHVERLDLSDVEPSNPPAGASHRRRPHGPRAPPGGSYRIPQQGQLQIIIKNQNKTAVKLFLIPYDLSTMEPGTKTFIRQRSYSAGPIIDSVPPLKDPSADRQILRYLVHLHICCPSRGRFYLYKSIRVVFANRVPDGKEKLRNEVTFPEPRYTPYKPVRVMHPPTGISGGSGYHTGAGGAGTSASLAAEKAFRRRSSGYTFTSLVPSPGFDVFGIQGNTHDVPAVPLIPNPLPLWRPDWKSPNSLGHVPLALNGTENDSIDAIATGGLCPSPTIATDSSIPHLPTTPAAQVDGKAADTLEHGSTTPVYKKLNKGDIGYGGNAFVSGSPTTFDSLLSQRLRAEKKTASEQEADTADE